MTKVIIVRGLSGTYKTSSIISAMNSLGFHVGNGPKDVLVMANLYLQGTSCLIGFASGGDTLQVMQANVAFFRSHTADILIFASRTRGAGRLFLDTFVQNLAVQPVIVPTQKASPPTSANVTACIAQTTQAILRQVP